jgi:hypothetical protein
MRFRSVSVLPLWSSTNLSASVTGPWHEITAADRLALQVTMGSAGTLNGTWTLQAGLGSTIDGLVGPSGNAATIEGSTYAVVNGLVAGEDTLIVNVSPASFTWIRWVWTTTSGTGTLTQSLISVKSE